MKYTHLVKFSFHFKKGKFQRYVLEVVKCRVFCLEKPMKNGEHLACLIRLTRTDKEKQSDCE